MDSRRNQRETVHETHSISDQSDAHKIISQNNNPSLGLVNTVQWNNKMAGAKEGEKKKDGRSIEV
jgi:hypothetical protein